MKNIISILTLLILFIILLLNTNLVIETTNNTIINFKNNLLPTIFPIFIISDLLINYDFYNIINNISYKILNKLFKINKSCCFIFILGIITGYSNTFNIILNLYNKKVINEKMINKIILFTNFINPLYLIAILKVILNFKLALIILFTSILSNIIIGIIYRNYNIDNNYINNDIKQLPLFICLNKSITKSINVLLMILGINIFISIISNILFNNSLIGILFKGLLDLTNGLSIINNLSFKLKIIFSCLFISFSGINTHLQCINLLPFVNYYKYLKCRILQFIISIIILIPVLLIY